MTQGLLQGLMPLGSVPAEYRRRSHRHAFSWLFIGAFFAVVLGQGPFVIRSLGGSAVQSLLLNVAQGIPLVPAILWVHFVERRNPVRLTGLFLGLGGVVMMFSGLAQGTWSLSILLAASLALVTIFRPILGTTLQQIYPTPWRGKLMSLPNTTDMLVRVLCLVGVGWLLRYDLESWRIVFPLAGLCMVVGAWYFRGISGSRGNREAGGRPESWGQHVRDSVRRALANRTLLVFLTGYFFVTCGGVVYGNILPLFARDELALDPAQWGIASAGFLGATLVSFWFWGRFMDRFGAPVTMLITWSAMAVLMGAVFFVHDWPTFLAIVSARGLVMSGNMLAFFPIVMHFTESRDTMRGMGLHSTFWGIRWVTMPSLVMLVVDGRLFPQRLLFLLSLALVLFGLAIMGRVWWRDRRRRGQQAAR